MAISVEDDSERESVPECFTFSLVDATGDIVDPSVATVCIEDNDGWFYTWLGNQKLIVSLLNTLLHIPIARQYIDVSV